MNATNMRTHTVTVDEPRIRYADSGTSDGLVVAELGLGTPHLVAPDVGASAVLFLAARHPVAIRGPGGRRRRCRLPLDVTGTLAERIPGSELTILPASHFAWEEIPDQFAALVTDSV